MAGEHHSGLELGGCCRPEGGGSSRSENRELERERFDLSPTPIKAALVMLQGEGYIAAVPRRGYFVAAVSAEDMVEIYELREVLEGRAAEKAAAAPDRARLADRLERVLAAQRRHVAAGQTTAYLDANVDFHRLIWTAAGNDRLAAIVENLRRADPAVRRHFGSGRGPTADRAGRTRRSSTPSVVVTARQPDDRRASTSRPRGPRSRPSTADRRRRGSQAPSRAGAERMRRWIARPQHRRH